ncbi:uncharacterized protein LOC134240693 [Saccostrea cucullata]|uniref:uncharacterized protein LOC134240693 n=1 Tax=Saccostrea cuccullata TaxID=36930 RepID=UPI002ED1DA22
MRMDESERESEDEGTGISITTQGTTQGTTVTGTRQPITITTVSTTVTTGRSGIIGNNTTSLQHSGGQNDTVILQAVLIPTFLGLVIIVALLLCYVYKAQVKEILKQAVEPIQKKRKKEAEINFKTLKEMEDSNQTYTDPSTYTTVENKVCVSSLPVQSETQQEAVPQEENYSALDRQNDGRKIAPIYDTNYDSLNHSNRTTISSISDGNNYSSLNSAFNSTENITSNPYGIYN